MSICKYELISLPSAMKNILPFELPTAMFNVYLLAFVTAMSKLRDSISNGKTFIHFQIYIFFVISSFAIIKEITLDFRFRSLYTMAAFGNFCPLSI